MDFPKRIVGVGILALAAVGCGAGNDDVTSPAPEVPTAGTAVENTTLGEPAPAPAGQTEAPEQPEETEPVTLKILDWEQTRALVETHREKVVVMDLWSTACPPCIVEFPNLVSLHQQRADQVACISVSLDYAGFDDEPVESYQEKVLTFLESQGATLENVLCATDSETIFNEKIDHGSMPVVYVFDQAGKLAAQFPDLEDPKEFTYQADIIPVVDALLAGQ